MAWIQYAAGRRYDPDTYQAQALDSRTGQWRDIGSIRYDPLTGLASDPTEGTPPPPPATVPGTPPPAAPRPIRGKSGKGGDVYYVAPGQALGAQLGAPDASYTTWGSMLPSRDVLAQIATAQQLAQQTGAQQNQQPNQQSYYGAPPPSRSFGPIYPGNVQVGGALPPGNLPGYPGSGAGAPLLAGMPNRPPMPQQAPMPGSDQALASAVAAERLKASA